MPVQIDTTAENNALRLINQGTHPSPPSVNHTLLYIVTGTNAGLYIQNDIGQKIGPFITGTSSAASSKTLIAELLPTGTTITLSSSIVGTYKKLTIEFAIRSTNASNDVDGYLQFNADTTAGNYYYNLNRLSQFGGTNDSGGSYIFSKTSVPANSADASGFCIGKIEIIQYANANMKKTALIQFGTFDNGFTQSVVGAIEWKNTNAITQIDMALSAGNFATNSVIRLYGET